MKDQSQKKVIFRSTPPSSSTTTTTSNNNGGNSNSYDNKFYSMKENTSSPYRGSGNKIPPSSPHKKTTSSPIINNTPTLQILTKTKPSTINTNVSVLQKEVPSPLLLENNSLNIVQQQLEKNDSFSIKNEMNLNKKSLNIIQENNNGFLEINNNNNLIIFNNDKQISNENNNYQVIGILGKQGVGKSKILNKLIGDDNIFPEEDIDCLLDCKFKTNGIDIYKHLDCIYLDTQPLFSCDKEYSPSSFDNISVEAVSAAALDSFVDLNSLQLALFIFSVCHVVIITLDYQTDVLEQFKMFQFIQTIRMLQEGIPSINQCRSSSQQKVNEGHVPEIIFIFNKVNDINEMNVLQYQKLLDLYFYDTIFRKNNMIHPNMWFNLNINNESHVNFYMIPLSSSDKSIENTIQILKKGINRMPKPNFKRMSQAEWFTNSLRNFEVIKKSYFIQEFIRKITSSMSVHN
ncbi:hypothetical protein ABK040_010791 [Willaertia magna]